MQLPALNTLTPFTVYGKVHKVSGFLIEATGIKAKVGTLCEIDCSPSPVQAEVIGFKSEITYLMSADELRGILPGAEVTQLDSFAKIPIGDGLLGRVIDAAGVPLDNLGELKRVERVPLYFEPINPLQRAAIRQPMDVGIKAINGLLTLGVGQRMGLFAGTGVGKSILLGMITQYCQADIVVISLVGERGREVKEFIEDNIGPAGMHKAVIVAAPADSSPLARIKAAETATFIAEYFKNELNALRISSFSDFISSPFVFLVILFRTIRSFLTIFLMILFRSPTFAEFLQNSKTSIIARKNW